MSDLDARFDEFHAANPQIAERLDRLATQWLAGHAEVGMKMLWEVLRWETGLSNSTAAKPFRLNNSYVSRYARIIINRHPSWTGRIKVRALRS